MQPSPYNPTMKLSYIITIVSIFVIFAFAMIMMGIKIKETNNDRSKQDMYILNLFMLIGLCLPVLAIFASLGVVVFGVNVSIQKPN
jgi:hypothetical protein